MIDAASPVRGAPPEIGCVAAREMTVASRQMTVRLLTATVWRERTGKARKFVQTRCHSETSVQIFPQIFSSVPSVFQVLLLFFFDTRRG